MIQIKSTEKTVPSNSQGLCNVQRTLSKFSFDLVKNTFQTVVQDKLFQEKEVTKTIIVYDEAKNEEIEEQVQVTERVYVEVRKAVPYTYNILDIDNFYQMLGSEITKNTGFTDGVIDNLLNVLISQTIQAKRLDMANWVVDNGDFVVVSKFSEVQDSTQSK